MSPMKHLLHDLSLRKSIILYISVFTLLALVLCAVTSSLCSRAQYKINESYPTIGEKYYLTNSKGERLGEGTYISKQVTPYSESDERLMTLLELLPILSAPVYSALCILAAALLFYRNKLKKPLAELTEASEKLSQSDLDFSIHYDSKDELGQLCASFEQMRSILAGNFAEMWRQVEDRKQLNAAFAHDLRTPLTVLKGYNELLQASEHPQTRDTAATMGKHIARMEAYINSMSQLRRLEDTQPEYQTIPLQPFFTSLQENAEILCSQSQKTLHLQERITIPQLSIDASFVLQVCNNLLSNAVRYAASSVTLSFSTTEGGLLLTVSDDGKGFAPETLSKAANPYFTGESDRSVHFGLGLYICRLLCERHGGWLKLENRHGGAAITAFFKSPD